MGKLQAALDWAARGYRVFPLTPNGKEPAWGEGWPEIATTDPDTIRAFWTDPVMRTEHDYNIGMDCTGLVVVDIDVKNGKDGHNEYVGLGGNYETLVVQTPSGGFHCYFDGPDSGNASISNAVDIRSHRGYVVAPGSWTEHIEGKQAEGWYQIVTDRARSRVPASIEPRLAPVRVRQEGFVADALDSPASIAAAISYLQTCPPAIEGQRGDETTYIVAARVVREMALSPGRALELIWEHFNPRCIPAWSWEELAGKVENAAQYGTADMGRLDPSVMFAAVDPDAIQPPASVFVQGGIAFGNAIDPEATPPRPWMVDRLLMLHETTMLLAAGSAGKSSISLALAAHLAVGRDFGPYKVHTACKSIVYNGEDDRPEQSRRLQAVCYAYNLDYQAVKANILLISSADLDLKLVFANGRIPFANEVIVNQLIELASATDVGLIVYDPLVDIHDVDEGDNPQMNFVMKTIQRIARAANVASLVAHHTSKASGGRAEDRAGNMDISRGASGIVFKSRIAFTLMNATESDCETYGLQAEERTSWVRMDDAKMQFTLANSDATWFRKQGVRIASGDAVGALVVSELKKNTSALRLRVAEIILGSMEANNTSTMTVSIAVALVKQEEPLYSAKTDVAVKQALVGYFTEAVMVRGRTLHLTVPTEGGKTPMMIMK